MVNITFFTRLSVFILAMGLLVACGGERSSTLQGAGAPTVESTETTATLTPQPQALTEDIETADTTPTTPATNIPTSMPEPLPTETAAPRPSPTSPDVAAEPTLTETAVPLPHAEGAIVVDHTSVDLFEQIPEEYLQAAANLRMIYIDRSVGANISDGLSCLAFESDEAAPNHCRRFEHPNPIFSSDPATVNWSRSGGYNRDNWAYTFWQEGACSQWYDKVDCFINMTTPIMDQYDVLSFQLSYLAVEESADIVNQPGGFFVDNTDRFDVYDLAVYEAAHPDKVFIYWTTSLSRQIGTAVSQDFNQQMRQYAITNNKPLFDVADILAHDPNGNPCYDNRDGVPYDNGNRSENHPDDGQDLLAICPHYTTEIDGGHLGSVSVGKIRLAKAFWVLMARIAGWDGS